MYVALGDEDFSQCRVTTFGIATTFNFLKALLALVVLIKLVVAGVTRYLVMVIAHRDEIADGHRGSMRYEVGRLEVGRSAVE